jgi:hypothetical protein
VLPTIDFDDQPQFNGTEIRDEWTDGMLAAKLGSREPPIAKTTPKEAFRIGLSAAKFACTVTMGVEHDVPSP